LAYRGEIAEDVERTADAWPRTQIDTDERIDVGIGALHGELIGGVMSPSLFGIDTSTKHAVSSPSTADAHTLPIEAVLSVGSRVHERV
jgi:hypothetical protein